VLAGVGGSRSPHSCSAIRDSRRSPSNRGRLNASASWRVAMPSWNVGPLIPKSPSRLTLGGARRERPISPAWPAVRSPAPARDRDAGTVPPPTRSPAASEHRSAPSPTLSVSLRVKWLEGSCPIARASSITARAASFSAISRKRAGACQLGPRPGGPSIPALTPASSWSCAGRRAAGPARTSALRAATSAAALTART
jgi:hypothetical protein